MGRGARSRVAGEAVGRWEGSRTHTGGRGCGQRGGAQERRPCGLTLLHPPQHHREEWTPLRGARCLPFHSSAQSPVSGRGWAEGVGGPLDMGGCWACAPPPAVVKTARPGQGRGLAVLPGLFRLSFRDAGALGAPSRRPQGPGLLLPCFLLQGRVSWVPAPFFFLEFRHTLVKGSKGQGCAPGSGWGSSPSSSLAPGIAWGPGIRSVASHPAHPWESPLPLG